MIQEPTKLLPAEAEAALSDFGLEGMFRVVDFTDFKATIKMFVQVDDRGIDVPMELPRFVSYVDIQYRNIPKTVPFKIEAATLGEARSKWRECALAAAEEALAGFEKEHTRLTLLQPAAPGVPFARSRH